MQKMSYMKVTKAKKRFFEKTPAVRNTGKSGLENIDFFHSFQKQPKGGKQEKTSPARPPPLAGPASPSGSAT